MTSQTGSVNPAPLTAEVSLRVGLLFLPEQRETASALLANECGTNLPFCANQAPAGLNRIRIAAIKLSNGDLEKLKNAVELAKRDWRDLLVAAGFAHDIHAHEEWLPEIRRVRSES
jgi:hypothetical protein